MCRSCWHSLERVSGRWKKCVIEEVPLGTLWFTKNSGTKQGEPLSSTQQAGNGCPPLSGAGRINVLCAYGPDEARGP